MSKRSMGIDAFAAACVGASLAAAIAGVGGQPAAAQTYGLATMQPGTLAHTAAPPSPRC